MVIFDSRKDAWPPRRPFDIDHDMRVVQQAREAVAQINDCLRVLAANGLSVRVEVQETEVIIEWPTVLSSVSISISRPL